MRWVGVVLIVAGKLLLSPRKKLAVFARNIRDISMASNGLATRVKRSFPKRSAFAAVVWHRWAFLCRSSHSIAVPALCLSCDVLGVRAFTRACVRIFFRGAVCGIICLDHSPRNLRGGRFYQSLARRW